MVLVFYAHDKAFPVYGIAMKYITPHCKDLNWAFYMRHYLIYCSIHDSRRKVLLLLYCTICADCMQIVTDTTVLFQRKLTIKSNRPYLKICYIIFKNPLHRQDKQMAFSPQPGTHGQSCGKFKQFYVSCGLDVRINCVNILFWCFF